MVKWVNELSAIYKEVDPKYFYRQIFKHHLDTKGAFTKGKYVGIACEITKEKKGKKTIVKRHTITDDLDTIDELRNSGLSRTETLSKVSIWLNHGPNREKMLLKSYIANAW